MFRPRKALPRDVFGPTRWAKVIRYPEWVGYFKGAKGNLVFFDADDGINGGMPFVVYDSKTGKSVFKDSYYDSSM